MGKHISGSQYSRSGISQTGERDCSALMARTGFDSLTPMGHSPQQGVYKALACVAASTYE